VNADPAWVAIARKLIGLQEIKGPEHAAEIVQMWKDIKRGGIKTDEVPWCAAFVGSCLERAGIRSSRFESAKSYLDWGVRLDGPVHGCVVVFARTGGGHVGFVVGIDSQSRLLVLGGNQNDEVSIRAFQWSRAVGFRWPVDHAIPKSGLDTAIADESVSEA
jgi:uncharacterized protein (TIGR02594 family)